MPVVDVKIPVAALDELSLPELCAVSGEDDGDMSMRVVRHERDDGSVRHFHVPVLATAVRRWHLIRLATVAVGLGWFLFWLYPSITGDFASPVTVKALVLLVGPTLAWGSFYLTRTWFFVKMHVENEVLVIRNAHPDFVHAVHHWLRRHGHQPAT